MCENADKTRHLKTLIAEVKVLIAEWQEKRKIRRPDGILPAHDHQRAGKKPDIDLAGM